MTSPANMSIVPLLQLFVKRLFRRKKSYRMLLKCAALGVLVIIIKLHWQNVHRQVPLESFPPVPVGMQGCHYPDMEPWTPIIKPFVKQLPPLVCSNMNNWIDIINGKFVISPDAAKQFGQISCQYKVFERHNDLTTTEGLPQTIKNNTHIPSDFFRVNCQSTSGQTYSNGHAGIHPIPELVEKIKPATAIGLGLNVLIIGFDSVSRMSMMRKMPKTYNYLINHLQAVVLKGYNIVGDGTPQALIPILTGKTELELPRILKRLNSKLHADVFPFAWKNFSDHGYATAWSEDSPQIGTFTYRMTGFKEQPTHHYMRVFHNIMSTSSLCIGDRSRLRVVLDWIKDFMNAYPNRPKFGFVFHNELSHDGNNPLQYGDDYLQQNLQFYKDSGLLNKTMLIVMSDHGLRYSGFRSTVRGKQEERNPFFSFVLPDWFRIKHVKAYNNLVKNSERLTTPFDIHPTLLDILNFGEPTVGNLSDRSISLFREIPVERTCPDAGIEAHWCNCLQFSSIAVNDSDVLKAAKAVVDQINKVTDYKRNICSKLDLSEIRAAVVFQHTKNMLAFKKTYDADGFAPELSDTTRATLRLLQLTILTSPNDGLYEATVKQNLDNNIFYVDRADISRLNKYGNTAHCVKDDAPDDRKFCFCKDMMPTDQR